MPNIDGFINGYAPSFTYATDASTRRPFVSFDYYLSPEPSEAEATADLREMANLNPQRPYFLLMHVREWSGIARVSRILEGLGEGFEVTPIDTFLSMARSKPTYEDHVQSSAP